MFEIKISNSNVKLYLHFL